MIAAAPLAAGCQSLVPGQGPPPDLYRLRPQSTFAEGLPTVEWQLLVDSPSSSAGLNTTRIALLHSPTRMEYYARSSWIDTAPVMLQSLLVQSFENSGKIAWVDRVAGDLRPDFILKTELREFQADYAQAAAPQVRVVVVARLVAMPRRAAIAAKRFEGSAPAAADRMEDIVAAFDIALGQVLGQIVAWTIEQGEAHRPGA